MPLFGGRSLFKSILLALILGVGTWIAGLFFFATSFRWLWPMSQPEVALIKIFVSPPLEETVFRGFLWGYLLGRLGNAAINLGWIQICLVNLTSSAIFSLYHWIWTDWLTALLVFLPSLYLGYLRRKGLTVSHCAVIHCVWNYGWIAVLP